MLHHHQIAQSPARLGLTNPNSPSPQNPNSQKFCSSQSGISQNVASIASSTLLPYLPPLSRAQCLLIQMASLVTKLLDIAPNRATWLSAFRAGCYPMPRVPLDPPPSSPREILSLFAALQSQLFDAVTELQEILDLQDAKQRLVREIKSKDAMVVNFTNKLKEAERALDMLVDDYSDYRRFKLGNSPAGNGGNAGMATIGSQLKLADILSYAHRISYTTFAPPEFGNGNTPLRGALPPAPQEQQMRASQLYRFADLDVGLPKRGELAEVRGEPVAGVESLAVEAGTRVDLAATSLQGMLPADIRVPSGWKPGMPVVLPTDLPVPPPGWKPGDPLPPLESLPLPRTQQLAPLMAANRLHKPPEPISVRHIQLDIMDQDDDSSDYSSELLSSDEDD